MTRRSAWLIVAAAVLPLLLLVVLQSGFAAREQRQRVESEALAQAKVVIAASDALVARTAGALDVLATSRGALSGDVAVLYERSSDLVELEPNWVAVIAARADGTMVFDTRRPLGEATADADGSAPSGRVIRSGAGCPCVAISRDAPRPEGRLVLSVLHSTAPFERLLPPGHGRFEVSALVNRDGMFVARSLAGAERVGTAGSAYLRKAVAGGASSGIYSGRTLEGFANYTAFARSPSTGWSAHMAMANRTIDSPRQRALGSIALAALLSLGFAGLMLAFALRQMAEGRRSAERLQQTQKLEALGQLTGGIAHDFNNLLTPIVGALDLLSKRDGLDERARRIAAGGLASANRAAKLTGQLLAFSRQQKLSLRPVDLCVLLEDIRPLLEQSAGGPARLVLASGQAGCWTETDPLQFELALINLVINARDAAPAGTPITVAVAPAKLRDRAAWRVAVSDRGLGMPDEVRARAFEPFFTTKETGRGTGLGLAQVFAFARQSNGETVIGSADGGGAEVSIFLPSCPPPEERGELLELEEGVQSAPLAILVVDDEREVREMIALTLEDHGHSVVLAASGAEGLERLGERRFEMCLVDFAMPGMNGAEFIAAARERHPVLRFLMVTGYLDSEAVEAAAPGTPILAKPFGPDRLLARVRALAAD